TPRQLQPATGPLRGTAQCVVHLWDITSQGVWYEIGKANYAQAGWYGLGGNGNRVNGHSRCGDGNPVND
ncbi:hypothetical protein, partial [Actinoplanes siamensis]|uniref:hypothetical protein n=1 Tax=Actinoplanes siamensis TaxID=1223317 RepID=UPI00361F5BDF